MRIVSLVPSGTEIVALVGAGTSLVGRSHECDWPIGVVKNLPILTTPRIEAGGECAATGGAGGVSAEIDGHVRAALAAGESLYRLDTKRLRELAPDLIITQSLCSVCSIDLDAVRAAAADMPTKPEILSLNPASFEDVLDDIVRVGDAVGRGPQAREQLARLRERFFTASDHVNAFTDPVPTLVLEWTDPMFVAGHWTAQLIERAGGFCPLNATAPMPGAGAGAGGQMAHRVAGPGRRVSMDEVAAFDPHAVIVCPCGFALERVRAEYAGLRAQPWWSRLKAVRDGRVALVDGNQMFNRPGPRLVDAYEWMVGWLQGVDPLIPAGFPWQRA
jgi:iron complex transport system substrate-binding protein